MAGFEGCGRSAVCGPALRKLAGPALASRERASRGLQSGYGRDFLVAGLFAPGDVRFWQSQLSRQVACRRRRFAG